jgi:hypothetical protein
MTKTIKRLSLHPKEKVLKKKHVKLYCKRRRYQLSDGKPVLNKD